MANSIAPSEDPEKCYDSVLAERAERIYINDCLRN